MKFPFTVVLAVGMCGISIANSSGFIPHDSSPKNFQFQNDITRPEAPNPAAQPSHVQEIRVKDDPTRNDPTQTAFMGLEPLPVQKTPIAMPGGVLAFPTHKVMYYVSYNLNGKTHWLRLNPEGLRNGTFKLPNIEPPHQVQISIDRKKDIPVTVPRVVNNNELMGSLRSLNKGAVEEVSEQDFLVMFHTATYMRVTK